MVQGVYIQSQINNYLRNKPNTALATTSHLLAPFPRPKLLIIGPRSRSCQIGNQLRRNLQYQRCCAVKHTLITSDCEVILNDCRCSALEHALLRTYTYFTTHEEPRTLKRFRWSCQPLPLLIYISPKEERCLSNCN